MDLNEKLLAAFQVEHIEHLEGIRACVAQWEQTGQAVNVDEAYRLTHNLKGAARVTGLTPVETLSHRLENVMSKMRSGELMPNERVLRVVHSALDAIEDAAACLLAGRSAADAAPVLAALDSVLQSEVATPTPSAPPSAAATRQAKLWAAFQEEYGAYVAAMRRLVILARQDGGAKETLDVDDSFRCANSLQGAARLAGAPAVAALAQRLEQVFSSVRARRITLNARTLTVVDQLLNAIEQAAPHANLTVAAPVIASALRAGDELLGVRQESAPPAAAAATPRETPALRASQAPVALPSPRARSGTETVRLSAESLNQLLQSSGRLMTENLRQDTLGRELDGIRRQLASVTSEWQLLQRTTGGGLRRLLEGSQSPGVGRFLELVEREVGSLVRRVRAARTLQRQSAWSVKQLAEQLQDDVRRARLVPAESVFQGFRKMMRDLAHDEGKEVSFRVEGLDVLADRMVLQALKDPLMHILRNAVSHGIELPADRAARGKPAVGQVSLELTAIGNQLTINITDDGRGIDLDRIRAKALERGLIGDADAESRTPQELTRLVFQPGFSTTTAVTDLAGRGMGLSIAYEAVSRLQGEIELAPREGAGVELRMAVPLSIATHRLLLVKVGEHTYAIPASNVEGVFRVPLSAIESVTGQPMVELQGRLTPIVSLQQALSGSAAPVDQETDTLQLVALRAAGKRLAVAVDAMIANRQALIKPLGPPADRVALYSGAILLEDGSVSLVLNPAELLERPVTAAVAPLPVEKRVAKAVAPTILVVDDSFTTRTLETSLLETNGYRVRVAVDGLEALAQLRTEKVDLVITDVQMPRLDGFGLIEEMKRDARIAKIPVIVVSSIDRREDQERGLHLGAEAYIVKKKFDHQELLKVIQQII